MTTEVAIMNRQAVALAADSAATAYSGGRPIYTHANKILSLGAKHAVGVMIYSSATFMGIPWETLIKMFRETLGNQQQHQLEDYGKLLVEFLENNKELFPEELQIKYAMSRIDDYFESLIIETLSHRLDFSFFENQSEINEEDIKKLFSDIVEEELEKYANGETYVNKPEEYGQLIEQKLGAHVDQIIAELFEIFPLDDKTIENLKQLATYLFIYHPEDSQEYDYTGVVISGFGDKDIFPRVQPLKIFGLLFGVLKFKKEEYKKVTHQNTALIMPFAQDEVMRTFIDGISPYLMSYNDFFFKYFVSELPQLILDEVEDLIDDEQENQIHKAIKAKRLKAYKKYKSNINRFMKEYNINPVLTVTSVMAKDELAELAESLVHLTCIKKKYSTEDETVGGPVDVAVISKGDGFVWIRRKNYFDSQDNYKFFNKYKRHGEQEVI